MDGDALVGSVLCLPPACKASTWARGDLGQSIPPMEPTDVELNLHGRSVPKELIRRVLELLTAAFASILLLMLPSKRAKCSWRKQRWRCVRNDSTAVHACTLEGPTPHIALTLSLLTVYTLHFTLRLSSGSPERETDTGQCGHNHCSTLHGPLGEVIMQSVEDD